MDYDLGDVISRNNLLDTLKRCKKRMEQAKKDELGHIDVDMCHSGMDSYIRSEYQFIINKMEDVIQAFECMDWCLNDKACEEITDGM